MCRCGRAGSITRRKIPACAASRIWSKSTSSRSATGGFLNLGISPDASGRMHPVDVKRLAEFKQALEAIRGGEFARGSIALNGGEAVLEFGGCRRINFVELAEPVAEEEKVTAYTVSLRSGGKWSEVFAGESIGLCRIRRFAETEGDALKVAVKSALAPVPELSVCAALAPEFRRDERETLRHPDYRKLGKSGGLRHGDGVRAAGGDGTARLCVHAGCGPSGGDAVTLPDFRLARRRMAVHRRRGVLQRARQSGAAGRLFLRAPARSG